MCGIGFDKIASALKTTCVNIGKIVFDPHSFIFVPSSSSRKLVKGKGALVSFGSKFYLPRKFCSNSFEH